MIVENLPDRRGARLAGAVAEADHGFRQAEGAACGWEFPLSLARDVVKGAGRRGKETNIYMNAYADNTTPREWGPAMIVVNRKGGEKESGRGP